MSYKSESILSLAISSGNIEIMELITSIPGLDYSCSTLGNTPFFDYAIKQGLEKDIDLLLKNDTLKINNNIESIFSAIYSKDPIYRKKIINKLLKNSKFNLGLRNKDGYTFLHFAVQTKDIDFIKLILPYYKNYINDQQNVNGDTPLHLALYNKNSSIVELLLNEDSINVNKPNSHLLIPIFYAIMYCDLDVIKVMLNSKKCDLSLRSKKFFDASLTPLHCAIRNCDNRKDDVNINIIKELLKAGANINVRNIQAMTPLFTAISKNNKKIIDELLKSGADPNIEVHDNLPNTPFTYIIEKDCYDILKIFLKIPKINVKPKNNYAPLNYAAKQGKLEAVKILLDFKNIDINFKGYFNRTALHEACLNGHDKIVKEILEFALMKNKQINLYDEKGRTPLITAIYSKQIEVIKVLLNYKSLVDINEKSEKRYIPLQVAIFVQDEKIIDLLFDDPRLNIYIKNNFNNREKILISAIDIGNMKIFEKISHFIHISANKWKYILDNCKKELGKKFNYDIEDYVNNLIRKE